MAASCRRNPRGRLATGIRSLRSGGRHDGNGQRVQGIHRQGQCARPGRRGDYRRRLRTDHHQPDRRHHHAGRRGNIRGVGFQQPFHRLGADPGHIRRKPRQLCRVEGRRRPGPRLGPIPHGRDQLPDPGVHHLPAGPLGQQDDEEG